MRRRGVAGASYRRFVGLVRDEGLEQTGQDDFRRRDKAKDVANRKAIGRELKKRVNCRSERTTSANSR